MTINFRPLKLELLFIAVITLSGLMVRSWHLERDVVEHFDEGIYASVLCHDVLKGEPYPARNFYAPPLLPYAIWLTSCIPGLEQSAPMIPAVVLGALTIPLIWLLARSWFGMSAGLFAATIVALSDYHIVYSRMAMTDVPCLFWILLSVWLGSMAIARSSVRWAVAAGVASGLAWWTKYTGWLSVAILVAGSATWWLRDGRRQISFARLAYLMIVVVLSTLATFAPWWWSLQSAGGYAAVSANHAGYVGGWEQWSRNLGRQLSFQFLQDGIFGIGSLCIGMLSASFMRWRVAGSSTGNLKTGRSKFPSVRVLIRFVFAAIALAILACRIWTPLMLVCMSLGGLSGIALWPVLRRAWISRDDVGPTVCSQTMLERQPWFTDADRRTAPLADPQLGLCLVLVWLVALLVVTPLYHPYSRLFLPLLSAVWIAAAGGVGWWIESNLSVAWRQQLEPQRNSGWTAFGRGMVSSMLAAAVVTSLVQFNQDRELEFIGLDSLPISPVQGDRRSIHRAAEQLTKLAQDAAGEIREQSGQDDVGQGGSPLNFVIYAYGEPALLFHIQSDDGLALPVSHLKLHAGLNELPVPTFLVIGPHAKRTPGFWDQWMDETSHFEWIADVKYSPGRASLLDLFSPEWLREHPESQEQVLELHRVR